MRCKAYPRNALPITRKTVLILRKPNVTTRLDNAMRIVRQSKMVSLPKLMQTVRMIATEAILTPSRKAENKGDFRILGTSGFNKATKTKDGRKTAVVARIAP